MKHALNQEKKLRVEERSVELALQPLLLAERDRGLTKFLKKQRDQEEDLFSDVPDWEVGTFYGTPVTLYKTKIIGDQMINFGSLSIQES